MMITTLPAINLDDWGTTLVLGLMAIPITTRLLLQVEQDYLHVKPLEEASPIQDLQDKKNYSLKEIFALVRIRLLIATVLGVIYAWWARQELPLALTAFIIPTGYILAFVYVIDRRVRLIPDRCQVFGASLGLLFVGALFISGEHPSDLLQDRIGGFAVCAGLWVLSVVYQRLRGQIGFGMGDLKLIFWMTIFIGNRILNVMMLGVLLAILQLIIRIVIDRFDSGEWKLPSGKDTQAFGPNIVIGIIVEGFFYYGT